jgi:hypothetical protein
MQDRAAGFVGRLDASTKSRQIVVGIDQITFDGYALFVVDVV